MRCITGRRRNLPDIISTESIKRAYAERQAVNSVIQGSASDLIKQAMIIVEGMLTREETDAIGARKTLVMQIHDELVYEVKAAQLDSFAMLLEECMVRLATESLQIKVPITIKLAVGSKWGNLTPYTKSAS